jgi:serine protease Do
MTLTPQIKTFLLGLSISLLVLVSFFGGALADRVFGVRPLDYLTGRRSGSLLPATSESQSTLQGLLNQAGSVADVAESASKSVVTVSVKKEQQVIDPFDQSIFGFGFQVPQAGRTEQVQRDIGTGFVVDQQGLIVTNKHVVGEPNAQYSVIDKDNKEYVVKKIYRDPANDLAILEVEGINLPPLPLGDSDKLRVGQAVIAIGTALGEFRHTVTTGVVSGLGRGIEAGDPFAGVVESLENVIQTDAAINPGNSGGPLMDGAGSVIGVNVAVTANAQNVGFAIPINTIKASIENFNQTGQFNRPFMGIRYRTITEQAALANEVPQGAYLLEVVNGSAAAEVGLKAGDIITEFDGKSLKEAELATLINQRKIGDKVSLKYWRSGQETTTEITMKASQ